MSARRPTAQQRKLHALYRATRALARQMGIQVEPTHLSLTNAAKAMGITRQQLRSYARIGYVLVHSVNGRLIVPVSEVRRYATSKRAPKVARAA